LLKKDAEFDEIYDILMKRMDDSQDIVRIEVSKAITIFFKLIKSDWKFENYDKMVRTLFVHFDDPNAEIRKSVEIVLKEAYSIHKAEFLQIVFLSVG